ncbi:hypothetical protein Scep_004919 [Stephania cephalantha]|uniref:Methyltransferase type 11 domain-containing protein n=1 Tax=Stephania cephalantha TaxID=152367 RepID=A0AAP0KU86_9MAGN
MMSFKLLKSLKSQILRGYIAKHVLIRVLLFVMAISIVPFLPSRPLPFGDNELAESSSSGAKLGQLLKPKNTVDMFPLLLPTLRYSYGDNEILAVVHLLKELMDEKLLKSGSKLLFVGDGSGLSVAALRELFPQCLGERVKRFTDGIEFKDDTFDFVFSTDIDTVSVPALLVVEIERVLRPGGFGAMLVAVGTSYYGNLIKAATPISTFLRSSNVVHARSVYSSSLVVFKKELLVGPFEGYRLPDECPAVKNNAHFMKELEPILDRKPNIYKPLISYLPKFMNVSSRRRFVYIDIGAGNMVNSNADNWLFSAYPKQSLPFDVYVVHHDTSFLSAYVKRPGITFVYHPGLAGNKATEILDNSDDLGPLVDDHEFDFIVWFRKTVAVGDLVIMKMNAVGEELKLLHQLFESGAICLVDELFLRCTDGNGDIHGDCADILKSARNRGVFAHQWLDE